ncbi:cytochrome P450 [Streptomyces sp. HK10]|uniref:cytochrome P450 n=1 Tax=Streptomyces sp. HK10 TaxID=3373255 RepID=UPI00374A3B20
MRISVPGPEPVDPAAFDLFDPESYATGDPHPAWAAMRAHAPLHRQELPDGREFVSVTRHADVCRVLGSHREFTSERGSLLQQLGQGEAAAGKMLVATDPPRHGELRRPLNRMLTGKGLDASRELVCEAARAVFRPPADGEVWDLAACAAELPMAVAGALMGLPPGDGPRLLKWTGMAAAPQDPAFRVHSAKATLAIAHHELFTYFSEQVRVRENGFRAEGPDLVQYLMEIPAGDAPLSREEVILNCYSLLLGANATTPHTVSGTVVALMENPGQYRLVREDPSLVPGLVEEGLRWTSAAGSFLRHAVTDVELSGGTVRAGEAVAAWVGSANRDERVFTCPYRFDVTRSDNRHIAFGFGPHYCLGAAVARLTLNAFFAEVVERVEEFEPAGEPVHLASNFVAGITRLPVRVRSSSRAASVRRTAAPPTEAPPTEARAAAVRGESDEGERHGVDRAPTDRRTAGDPRHSPGRSGDPAGR